jgi:hypothetical protein
MSPPTVATNFRRFVNEQLPVSAASLPIFALAPAAAAPAAPSLTAQLALHRQQQRAGQAAPTAPLQCWVKLGELITCIT